MQLLVQDVYSFLERRRRQLEEQRGVEAAMKKPSVLHQMQELSHLRVLQNLEHTLTKEVLLLVVVVVLLLCCCCCVVDGSVVIGGIVGGVVVVVMLLCWCFVLWIFFKLNPILIIALIIMPL